MVHAAALCIGNWTCVTHTSLMRNDLFWANIGAGAGMSSAGAGMSSAISSLLSENIESETEEVSDFVG